MAVLSLGFSGCFYNLPDMPKRPLDKNPANRVIPYSTIVNYGFKAGSDNVFGFVYNRSQDPITYLYTYTLDAVTISSDGSYSKNLIDSYTIATDVEQFINILCCKGSDNFIAFQKTTDTDIHIWSFMTSARYTVSIGIATPLQAISSSKTGHILCGFLTPGNTPVFRDINTSTWSSIGLTPLTPLNQLLDIRYLDDATIVAYVNNTSNNVQEYYYPLDGSTPTFQLIAAPNMGVLAFQFIPNNGSFTEFLYYDADDYYISSVRKEGNSWYGASVSVYLYNRYCGFGAIRNSAGGIFVVTVPNYYYPNAWEYEINHYTGINAPAPLFTQRVYTYYNLDINKQVVFVAPPDANYAFMALRPGVMEGVNGLIYQMYKEL
jgi:hypothetical protein